MQPKILAIAAAKGGSGKTTSAAALAQAATADGKRVLVVDLDPQGNLTFAVGANHNAPGSYHLLHATPALELVQTTEQGIDAISASPNLATEETKAGSAMRLQQALQPVQDNYDLILIDTPATIGELLFNSLQACTGLLIPLEAEAYSLQGLYQLTDIVQLMRRRKTDLAITGTILTRFDPRPKFSRFMQDTIKAKSEELGAPYLGAIRKSVVIQEAQAMQQSLFDYAPKSTPAEDYERIYKIIMEA